MAVFSYYYNDLISLTKFNYLGTWMFTYACHLFSCLIYVFELNYSLLNDNCLQLLRKVNHIDSIYAVESLQGLVKLKGQVAEPDFVGDYAVFEHKEQKASVARKISHPCVS